MAMTASEHDTADGDTAWKSNTSAFDRVRAVALSLSQLRSAAWIADEALVAAGANGFIPYFHS